MIYGVSSEWTIVMRKPHALFLIIPLFIEMMKQQTICGKQVSDEYQSLHIHLN